MTDVYSNDTARDGLADPWSSAPRTANQGCAADGQNANSWPRFDGVPVPDTLIPSLLCDLVQPTCGRIPRASPRSADTLTEPSREARVPRLPLDEAKAAADEAGVPDYMAELAIFQVLLNHPRLAGSLNDLLAIMLWHGKLDARLRELAIMRIAWLTASEYEWTQHWRVAQGLGVSADDLLGVREWQSHRGFGPAERAVLACDRRRGARRRGERAELGGVPAARSVPTRRCSSSSSPRSARGVWSPRFCTACRFRWKTMSRAGRRTVNHRLLGPPELLIDTSVIVGQHISIRLAIAARLRRFK